MFKVAIDLGYGYIKGVNERGETYLCRTSVGSGINRQFSEVFGTLKKTDEHIIISQNQIEKQYFIGELARKQSRDCSSPFDKNKVDHPATKVLLAAAVAKLTQRNKEPVHLVTGPPLLYAAEQKQSFIDSLSNYEAIVQFAGQSQIHICKFDRVSIFPQGAAVVYYLLKNHPELATQGSIFIIIEPGYKTTEILPFEISSQKRIEPIDGYATTLETGMHIVEKSIDEAFYNKTGSRLNLAMIDKVMNTNEPVFYQGKEIDLSKEKNIAKDELARTILDGANQALGDYINYAKKIAFGGGVSADPYISERFKSFSNNSIILPDSQFANAWGLLEVAKSIELKEKQYCPTR